LFLNIIYTNEINQKKIKGSLLFERREPFSVLKTVQKGKTSENQRPY